MEFRLCQPFSLSLSMLVAGGVSEAATYYVGKSSSTVNASDSNSCSTARNPLTPKLSIQAGVQCLVAGDTLLIRAGVYKNNNVAFRNLRGTASAWITVKPYPGEAVVLDGGGIGFFNSHYIELANFEMTNSAFMQSGYFNNCGVFDDACQENVKKMCDLTTQDCQAKWHSWRESYGSQIFLSGSCCASGISDHIIIRNNHIHHAAGGGINGSGERIQILNNHIHHLGIRGWGMANPMYLSLNNSVVRGNVCHDTSGTDGMRFADYPLVPNGPPSGVDNIIEQNTSYGHGGRPWYAGTRRDGGNGITFYPAGNRNLVRNNLLIGNRGYGIQNSKGTANYVGAHFIYNNTFYGNGVGAVTDNSNSRYCNNIGFRNHVLRAGNGSSYRSSSGSTSTLQNNLWDIDPLFMNPATHDFRLRPNSPAIDRGMSLAKDVPNDFLGRLRPQGAGFDIGAHEFAVSRSMPMAPGGLRIR